MGFVQKYQSELHELILQESQNIELVLEHLAENLRNGKEFVLAGNGGNFANILHMGTDWTKGLKTIFGDGMNLRILGVNPALNSAYVNDFGHENSLSNLFLLEHFNGSPVVILFSAGGTSKNILDLAKTAKLSGAKVIGLMGGLNFNSHALFDLLVHFKSNDIQHVEDAHAIFGHMFYKFMLSKK